jgi:hypothetical protein
MNLSFGNPNREYLSYLQSETYLDSLLEELKNYPPKAYDSAEVQEEINNLVQMSSNFSSADNAVKERFFQYDIEPKEYIASLISNAGGIPKAEVRSIIDEVNADITPLLYKLKYSYQRIRPYQLAFYYNLPLYPSNSCSANSPSYPSGHSFQAKIICEVLGNKYPQFYKSLQQLAEDISVSRLYLGLHYESDAEFGKYCADVVLNHPDFKRKYKL